MEATYRPMADPSRPERELDAPAARRPPAAAEAGRGRPQADRAVWRPRVAQGAGGARRRPSGPTAPSRPTPANRTDATRPDTAKVIPTRRGSSRTRSRELAQPSVARATRPPPAAPAAGFYVQVAAVKTQAAAVTRHHPCQTGGLRRGDGPRGRLPEDPRRSLSHSGREPTEVSGGPRPESLAERPFVVRVP